MQNLFHTVLPCNMLASTRLLYYAKNGASLLTINDHQQRRTDAASQITQNNVLEPQGSTTVTHMPP